MSANLTIPVLARCAVEFAAGEDNDGWDGAKSGDTAGIFLYFFPLLFFSLIISLDVGRYLCSFNLWVDHMIVGPWSLCM